MANGASRTRGSITGALILILIGVIFLYANIRPEWNPWPIISRYWPVLLIVLGLGKLVDVLRTDHSSGPSGTPPRPRRGGEAAAIVIVVLLLVLAVAGSHRFSRTSHLSRSVDAQGAQSARISIEMPAGQLTVSGGATKLLEGDFDYPESDGAPRISYDHSGTEGNLSISQTRHAHLIGPSGKNDWNLRLNNDEARELRLDMGAGQGDLNLQGTRLTKLTVDMGAGELNADLTGDWKSNVDVRIEGGVGSATVRLPTSVGVLVHAQGGLGSIDVRGLRHQGDDYVNDAYGKSPVTMNVSVEGGVGEIRLIAE